MLTFSWILQSFSDVMLNFVRNVRIVDILDIAIIAVFLYMMLNWLRQSASQRGLISFAILIGGFAEPSNLMVYLIICRFRRTSHIIQLIR